MCTRCICPLGTCACSVHCRCLQDVTHELAVVLVCSEWSSCSWICNWHSSAREICSGESIFGSWYYLYLSSAGILTLVTVAWWLLEDLCMCVKTHMCLCMHKLSYLAFMNVVWYRGKADRSSRFFLSGGASCSSLLSLQKFFSCKEFHSCVSLADKQPEFLQDDPAGLKTLQKPSWIR